MWWFVFLILQRESEVDVSPIAYVFFILYITLMSCNRATHLTVIILLNLIMLLRLPGTIPVFLPSSSLTFENAYLRRGNIQALIAIPRSRSYSIAIHHSPTALQSYCFSLEVEIGLPFKIFSFRYWKESISIMLIGYTLSA